MRSLYQDKLSCLVVSILLLSCFVPSIYCQVTSPEAYLGYRPGDNFHLATYEKLIGYFELLDSESERIQVWDMGPTTEGRRMKYAIISSEENMADLDGYKRIVRKLSLARGVSEEEVKRLVKEGKVVVWIDSGIHASETSPPMHQFQLAYDLVSGMDGQTQSILENVILLLVQANPDGMTLVADWYMKNLGTPYETCRLPFLYHKYAGHDNNRDTFMANLLETQNMNRIVGREWFPHILYVQHETAPFPARIWIPPNPEPVNPNLHPMVTRWKNLIGSAMGHGFEGADQPGAISRTAFDLWYPGYADGPSVEGHNIPTVLTETANYRYATPHYYTLYDFPESYRDLITGTFYPSPWEGGWWRFKDAVAYNLTASRTVLDVAAKYRSELLYFKYKMGKDVIERFKHEPPYGWIIPLDQPDINATALMLNRFMNYGIEVYRCDEAFTLDGLRYPRGTIIIPTSQAFGYYVKNILENQSYPDLRKYGHLWQGISRIQKWDGAPLAPYDGVGWTLPAQMGVEARCMHTPLTAKLTRVTDEIVPIGEIFGRGSQTLISNTDNHSFSAVNHILQDGGEVRVALSDFILGGETYPRGSFIVNSRSIGGQRLREIASSTGIEMQGGNARIGSKSVIKSRIALYKSWVANMDAGWISYVLEKYHFPYRFIQDAEMKAGNLNDRFDVLILPDQSALSIIQGHRKGTMPPNYVGGITTDGVENIKRFVESGGLLICNKSACDFAIDQFQLPLHNVLKEVKPDSFNCPGSLLKVKYDVSHPITQGMPEMGMAYFSRARVFELLPDTALTKDRADEKISHENIDSLRVVAAYPDESLLISGWILGDEIIRGKAAIVEVPFGKGKIILFGFNVHNRAQALSTFKLLFNAIYL